ncbi:cyclase family protein [Alicyclobacillus dauci]|uniref:Cyclase family protein n=1 Tax=Alicyclobacillus dauci TaxID=1475485 RepID=A0ABY6YXK4_9BACL|nr:cyclase family protein [Alicyclobacillus dauci]WAH35215.1 cyclase family protein [Alicyclobacillus dauci]
MSRFVDLTMPWGPEVQVLEGHPQIQFRPITTHEVDGRSNTEVKFSIHSGTHIDAPYHFFAGGKSIAQMPLTTFYGEARLVDLREVGSPNHEISLAELREVGKLSAADVQGKRIVLRTDWAATNWNQPVLYADNPYLEEEAARWLVDSGVVALGLDFAVDGAPPYPNHPIFLGNEIPLIENLVNLDQIAAEEFTLIAFPLPVVGGDGSPARVVALVNA